MALPVGAKAPSFDLDSTAGGKTSLASLRGRRFVLFFYPKDNTPGCTREAVEFGERYQAFLDLGVEVLGISKDSLASHRRFQEKHPIPFPLLSDPDSAVAKAFGAFGIKKMYGKEIEGTIRSTFLVNEEGVVEGSWSPVRVPGHADAVLAEARERAAR